MLPGHDTAGTMPMTRREKLILEDFEVDLANNLYKLWNRMSSGSYFPAPVRRVDIPKSDGKTRPLGIPTVADRIAQMVVKPISGTARGTCVPPRFAFRVGNGWPSLGSMSIQANVRY
jgi:hypothetical protein